MYIYPSKASFSPRSCSYILPLHIVFSIHNPLISLSYLYVIYFLTSIFPFHRRSSPSLRISPIGLFITFSTVLFSPFLSTRSHHQSVFPFTHSQLHILNSLFTFTPSSLPFMILPMACVPCTGVSLISPSITPGLQDTGEGRRRHHCHHHHHHQNHKPSEIMFVIELFLSLSKIKRENTLHESVIGFIAYPRHPCQPLHTTVALQSFFTHYSYTTCIAAVSGHNIISR